MAAAAAPKYPAWVESFGGVAAILLAFFVFLATLRLTENELAGAGPEDEEREAAAAKAPGTTPFPPAAPIAPAARSCAAEIRANLGERADLLDLFESARELSPPGARLRIRFDRSCDFEPGSDRLEFVAARLVADLGAVLAARGGTITVAAASEPGESEAGGGLAARRALSAADALVSAGVGARSLELRAEASDDRGRSLELVVDEGALARTAAVPRERR
jgi:flagellar motor protein MotB